MICNNSQRNGLLYATFNQDYGCFACGMCNGFRIYNTEPLKEKERQDFPGMGLRGGVRLVEMLFRCNYVGLAFADNARYPPNKAVIWDDVKKKFVIELEFTSEVVAIRLRRDKIVVVLESAVKVFSFTQPPSLLHIFETCENPHGLVALCPASDRPLLAFPARALGSVTLADLGDPDRPGNPAAFAAHEGRLVAMAMNCQGTMLATASEKGTIIRVFSLLAGDSGDAGSSTRPQLAQELRRGTHAARIYCISFSADSCLLCCSSDHGTVHVFRLQRHDAPGAAGSSVAKFFSQVTSVARVTIPANVPTLCAFGQDSMGLGRATSVIVVTASGSYLKFNLSSGAEPPCREVYAHFLEMTHEDSASEN